MEEPASTRLVISSLCWFPHPTPPAPLPSPIPPSPSPSAATAAPPAPPPFFPQCPLLCIFPYTVIIFPCHAAGLLSFLSINTMH